MAQWREQFLAGGQSALKSRPADDRDDEIQRLRAKGEPAFTTAEAERMSQTCSPSTTQRYGLARVCRMWELARSTGRLLKEAPGARREDFVRPRLAALGVAAED